ncbi:MAG: glycine cleavage system protein GcvH [Eubacteriales bacterium]|jgi:glycine cleavage system H protein
MTIPENLLYSKTHEWVEKHGETVRVGITDHAQDSLGDIVFVGLPAVGDRVEIGKSLADVESVKAVAEVYSPVTGVVLSVNDALVSSPELINEDAYAAWLVEIAAESFEDLLDAAAYGKLLEEEG